MNKYKKLSIMALGLLAGITSEIQAGFRDVLETGDPDQVKRYCAREAARTKKNQDLKAYYERLASHYESGQYMELLGTPELENLTRGILCAEDALKERKPVVLTKLPDLNAQAAILMDPDLAFALTIASEEDPGSNEGTASAAAASNKADLYDHDFLFAQSLAEEDQRESQAHAARNATSQMNDYLLALSLQETEENSNGHAASAAPAKAPPKLILASAESKKKQPIPSASTPHVNTERDARRKALLEIKTLAAEVTPEQLPFGMDVHALDAKVGGYLPRTLQSMATLNMGNPRLTFDVIAAEMTEFFAQNGINLVVSTNAGETPRHLSKEALRSFIPRIFKADFKGLGHDFNQMLSRAWSQAKTNAEISRDNRGVTHIAIALAENYLGGGTDCLQGRRNRMLVASMRITAEFAETL